MQWLFSLAFSKTQFRKAILNRCNELQCILSRSIFAECSKLANKKQNIKYNESWCYDYVQYLVKPWCYFCIVTKIAMKTCFKTRTVCAVICYDKCLYVTNVIWLVLYALYVPCIVFYYMMSAVFEKLEQKTGNCKDFVIFTTVWGLGWPRSLINSIRVSVFQRMPSILVSCLQKTSLRQFL